MSKMIYVEAPNNLAYPSLFLAGGITDCPDWQSEVVEFLKSFPIKVYNPRRADFPIGNPEAAQEQIAWEFHYLNVADFILFWFPKETLCPIVLYELGKYGNAIGMSKDNVVVGTHLHYPRREDVIIQTRLKHGEDFPIHAQLSEVLHDLIKKMDERYKILEAINYPHKFMNRDVFGDLYHAAADKVFKRKKAKNDKANSKTE